MNFLNKQIQEILSSVSLEGENYFDIKAENKE